MARSVNFFQEDISFPLKDKTKLKHWVKDTISKEGKVLGEVNFVFCSDSYLLEMNKHYLDHDTFTDIITFDNSEEEDVISGDIFISYERVKENASQFNVSVSDELHRIMIHGILHLIGYKDKSKEQKSLMTQKEDTYLSLRTL